MDRTLVAKYAAPVPRYTSYPTAPHFNAAVSSTTYGGWLRALPKGANASLYIHIPYCDRLCWFCACHTRQTRRYDPVERYLKALEREIDTVAALCGSRLNIRSLHLGGGSPTMLTPKDMMALGGRLRAKFAFAGDAEISVEIDPNDMDEARFDALAAIGLTRASLGVQDFDERVQKTINREQSFEQTKAVVDAVRARGVRSVNLDMLYGLPHQTLDSIAATTEKLLSLRPDRIALFGYAHVPWLKKHQTMIDDTLLPDTAARLEQSELAMRLILAAGYEAVGMDHFALPEDSLAVAARVGTLRRNFQGYTTDQADALIGLGASSIGLLPHGYVQNMPATGEYERRVLAGGLATVRGFALSNADRMRAWVIERLMCDFSFSRCELLNRFGAGARSLIAEAELLAANDRDGVFVRAGNRFVVTERGKPFVRSIAAAFDAYLGQGTARHSVAV
ncbi:anaerobic coproporphyrinogen III oxidase [Aminobacter aminovorans]|uniref:Coproporphyrinogen-III oxidase n=1 Tax=Aminobacter aminovorans TaxID=83263 RepID=A0A380WEV2_AMIAI|nr:oxygen-independent coproporphyrinogen III oxidase [Aminobacter aminovorans]TCS23835.1 anaerobic coproporphyrinogen III oxidase [Aminobacter aminovorans]SUU87553.1 Oxygen-independent coproporphyrinogen-III oxidase [Aminobacter aminovorans]